MAYKQVEKTVGLSFGALGGTLAAQLKKQKVIFEEKQMKKFESCRHSITVLMFNDILTQSETKKAYDKLHKQIMKHLNQKHTAKPTAKPTS